MYKPVDYRPQLDGVKPVSSLLVVRQPKIAGWRSAEEQGSRGAEERFVQVLSPLPLRTSASLLATTQSYLGRLLERSLC
ncbi:hypothetical protein [Nostoc sp.]|uniref:hypothetical protein n=1 Tax=Nostoc sp. TaxID=1180 RepID=UPI002FF5CD4F